MTRWKVDPEPRDDAFWIYAVPDVGPLRGIARCERKEDAELIVKLYEAHRKASV